MPAGLNTPTSPISCRASIKWRKRPGARSKSIPVTVFGVAEGADRLQLYRDRGIARAVVSLPSAPADETLPTLDRWATLIRRLG